MGPTSLPLRWESTGDQWWFASPIDWAAANGHYDVVRHLLHIDPNLLINLTSLPRIRRLETVWDDADADVAKCRSHVARKLLRACETNNNGHNSLIGAGYGGWLLYTAASAGDSGFVAELLGRDPLLVFGEGEYGVTDMLYAAARSKRGDVFGMLFDSCVSPRGLQVKVSPVFRSEMVSRAVHAAARGGSVEVLRDLLGDGDVFSFRDGMGSTVLHTASGRGQVEVVKHLISSYKIINSTDNRGNTALHVAAYRGQLSVVELLASAASLTNNYGDTFLHMAVSGFRAPGFRRIDRQTELIKQIVTGKSIILQDIINVKNNEGRTALHLAIIENIQSNIVELLMSVRCIDLNIRDADGHTPLGLLKQRPRSSASETLIKRLISAGGGISDCPRNVLVSHLRMRGIGGSPGTSFRIPDGEILFYAGTRDLGTPTSTEDGYSGEIKNASLKNFLRWPGKNERDVDVSYLEDNYLVDFRSGSLRQQFSRQASLLPNNKRIMALPGGGNSMTPSPSAKKKFAAGLTQGVLRVGSRTYFGSPSSAYSESSWSSPVSNDGRQSVTGEGEAKMKRKNGSFNLRLMNNYLCFGAQSLGAEKSV